MVESTAVSCIHPEKYNNSVDRIISKEEEREDPRRDSSIYLRVVFPQRIHIPTRTTRTTVLLHAIRQVSSHPVQRKLFYIQNKFFYRNSPRNTTTTRLIPCRLLPATVPCASKHSTRQNKAPGFPTAFQGHTAQAGFQ